MKSSVETGPKIRSSDNAAVLALSAKVKSCCWAMIELGSSELDCTTNLRHIYDHLPDPLQAKSSKAKSYRERTNGKEPTLMELSRFITAEFLFNYLFQTQTLFYNPKKKGKRKVTQTNIYTPGSYNVADAFNNKTELIFHFLLKYSSLLFCLQTYFSVSYFNLIFCRNPGIFGSSFLLLHSHRCNFPKIIKQFSKGHLFVGIPITMSFVVRLIWKFVRLS